MATRTLGTNATTTLAAIPWPNLDSTTPQTDIAAIANAIIDDQPQLFVPPNPPAPSSPYPAGTAQNPIYAALANNGILLVPNRGILRVLPGDWVGVDATGWPILLSPRAISGISGGPTPSWTHSGNST